MKRPDLATVPPFYKGYVEFVKDYEIMEILNLSNQRTLKLVRSIPEDKGEFRYASEKWSIKELLCHMMDAERIFAYRALRFARNDKTPLAGFEETDYAPEANAHGRTIVDIADEMERLRLSTVDLYRSFTTEMLLRKGTANNTEISVLNIGYVIPGHETHHTSVLKNRYLV
ncbi:MAG: DNA damage-inducible protein DinB [Marivirga sp.]|nr:DNA damage-inducible protein DinB [Marivirga sp.]